METAGFQNTNIYFSLQQFSAVGMGPGHQAPSLLVAEHSASNLCYLPRVLKYFLFPHKPNNTKMSFKSKMLRLYSRYISGIITKQQNFNLWNTVILTPL